MPKIDGIGFGDCTKIKIEHFSRIVNMHLAITQSVLNKHSNKFKPSYHYVELTAGKGFTPDGNKGSPIAFLENAEAESFTIPYRADFIECESNSAIELERVLEKQKQRNQWHGEEWHFHCGKYQEIITRIFKYKENEFGLVFMDPSGDLPDFEILRFIAEMRPMMEILIYLPSTNIKRIYQYTEMRLSDYIASVGKKSWLIREAINWDKLKWTFLLGSNSSLFKNYKKIGFYQLDGKEGQLILEKLNFTEKEQFESKQYKLDLNI